MALQAILPFGVRGFWRALATVRVATQAAGRVLPLHRMGNGWCTAAGQNHSARQASGTDGADR
jgi:hypothetical protein